MFSSDSFEERRRALAALVRRVREHAMLTDTEEEVLLARLFGQPSGVLLDGRTIKASTQRTHVVHIRQKTGYRSIRALCDTIVRRFYFGAPVTTSVCETDIFP